MFSIDYKDRTPIYEQIVKSVEKMIALGVLKPDEKLPSVRSLGIELSTNPNTIQKAYTALEAKGVVYSVKGIGNFVSSRDVKTQKLEEIYEMIKEQYKNAVSYGLAKEEFEKWSKKIKEIVYDKSE